MATSSLFFREKNNKNKKGKNKNVALQEIVRTVNIHHGVCGTQGRCRNVWFLDNIGQTAVCRGVPEVWVGDGVCSEKDSEWAEASLCSSSTLLWSSALRNSSSFRLWCTGTCESNRRVWGQNLPLKKPPPSVSCARGVLPVVSCAGSSGRSSCSTAPGVWRIPPGTGRGARSPHKRGW